MCVTALVTLAIAIIFKTSATTNFAQGVISAFGAFVVAKTGSGYAYYLTAIPVIYSTHFFEEQAAWMGNREAFLAEYFGREDVRQALIRLTDSSVGYNVVDRLHEITCPTLILSSSEDVLVPPHGVAAAARKDQRQRLHHPGWLRPYQYVRESCSFRGPDTGFCQPAGRRHFNLNRR